MKGFVAWGDQIKENEMEGIRVAYKIFIVKCERRRSVGRSRLRWEDDIKMYLREIVCVVMDWDPGWLSRYRDCVAGGRPGFDSCQGQ
jgi:hypothetical protein